MNKIRYIDWHYGSKRDKGYRESLHLIRWTNGRATLHTTKEMRAKGLAK